MTEFCQSSDPNDAFVPSFRLEVVHPFQEGDRSALCREDFNVRFWHNNLATNELSHFCDESSTPFCSNQK